MTDPSSLPIQISLRDAHAAGVLLHRHMLAKPSSRTISGMLLVPGVTHVANASSANRLITTETTPTDRSEEYVHSEGAAARFWLKYGGVDCIPPLPPRPPVPLYPITDTLCL